MHGQVFPDEAGPILPDNPFLRQELAKRHSAEDGVDSGLAQHPPEEYPRRGRSAFAITVAAAAAATSAMDGSYESHHPASTTFPGIRPMSAHDIVSRVFPRDITGQADGTYGGHSPAATAPRGADPNRSFMDRIARLGGVPAHDNAGGTTNKNNHSRYSDGRSGRGGGGGGGSRSGSSGTSSSSTQPPPPPKELHASPCLKVGEVLTGSLLSPGGSSLVHGNAEDGSLVFERVAAIAPRDASGRENSTTTPIVGTILLPADPQRVARVKQVRSDISEEEREMAEKGGKKATILGWLPFGKAGWRQRRRRERAREHLGEVGIRITDKGVLVRRALCYLLIPPPSFPSMVYG